MSHAHDILLARRRDLQREIEFAKNNIRDHMADVERATAQKLLAEQHLREVDEVLDKLAELPQQ